MTESDCDISNRVNAIPSHSTLNPAARAAQYFTRDEEVVAKLALQVCTVKYQAIPTSFYFHLLFVFVKVSEFKCAHIFRRILTF